MIELSQQATVVALAAIVPVITSVYKLRVFDASVLAISGVLAVYNVNCLTRGNCNAWATLVAMSFFAVTLLKLGKREGLDSWNSWKNSDGLPDFSKLDGKITIPGDFDVSKFTDMIEDLRKALSGLENLIEDNVLSIGGACLPGRNMIDEIIDSISQIQEKEESLRSLLTGGPCQK
jgi:hypothetical protein